MSKVIDDKWIFENAAGLSCQIDGWPKFAAGATDGQKKEAMLILTHTTLTSCQRAALLRRLMESCKAAAAVIAVLLLSCSVFAGNQPPPPVPVRIDVDAGSELYPAARRTAAVVQTVNQRIIDKYPGLSRYAREHDYTVVIADLPDGIRGRHNRPRRTIELDVALGADPQTLSYVYAHEIGHAIYEELPHIERQEVAAEYATELEAGRMRSASLPEVFAELTARMASGMLVDVMPKTQKLIRRRIFK